MSQKDDKQMQDVSMEHIRQQVIERMDMTTELEEKEIHEVIDRVMLQNLNCKYMPIEERYKIHQNIYHSIKGLGVLEEFLSNDNITEIMVNGAETIFIEKEGVIERANASFSSEERLADIIQQIVAKTNRRVNESDPIVDTRLEDGSRINVVLPPIALDGAVLTIRKFPKNQITIEQLIQWNTITEEAALFLKNMVIAGYNIFVCGGTGSGKTTFLNVLSNFIPKDERVITIEDSAELQLREVENLVRLEARQKNTAGKNEVPIRELIKTSLRMRPDRIIVGEVRGKEALDMLQAMNTGHDGSMSTGHANSPVDMLSRLETMVLMGVDMPLPAIRAQIASAIDIIVHLGRTRDKSRKVLEICEVCGICSGEIQLQKLFEQKENGKERRLIRTKIALCNTKKLESKGLQK